MREMIESAAPHMLRHYRSDTHWYIPHSAGQLKIALTKTFPCVKEIIPGITSYWHGKGSKTTVTITSQEEFETALASADANLLYCDPGEISAKWVLPDGTVVEGLSIDVDVPEGETLCIISPGFRWCDVDASECGILLHEWRDLPPFQGAIHLRGGRKHALSELADREPIWDSKRRWKKGGVRIRGSASCPSNAYGTVEDINNTFTYICSGIEIQYAPDITGDLARLNIPHLEPDYSIWGTSYTRTYKPHITYPNGSVTRDGSAEVNHISFHHCGVYGVPDLGHSNMVFDWEYYACPNATPEDFDGLIDQLMTSSFYTNHPIIVDGFFTGEYDPVTVDGVGFTWWAMQMGSMTSTLTSASNLPLSGYSYEAGKQIVPAYGTLKISNRTADSAARAEKLAILRAAGWTVEEIDDSLEDDIYATRDV